MRTGRPPIDPVERRTASVTIPLTDAEKQRLVAAASDAGEKPATWARNVILKVVNRRKRS